MNPYPVGWRSHRGSAGSNPVGGVTNLRQHKIGDGVCFPNLRPSTPAKLCSADGSRTSMQSTLLPLDTVVGSAELRVLDGASEWTLGSGLCGGPPDHGDMTQQAANASPARDCRMMRVRPSSAL